MARAVTPQQLLPASLRTNADSFLKGASIAAAEHLFFETLHVIFQSECASYLEANAQMLEIKKRVKSLD
jgi:hypothetical protein